MTKKMWGSVCLAALLAAAGMAQERAVRQAAPGTAAYEVEATTKGNLVAWPKDRLSKEEIWKWSALAESDIASRGEVSPDTLKQLRFNFKIELSRQAPGASPSGDAAEVRTGLVMPATPAGTCARGVRRCATSSGEACAEAGQACRCACVVMSGPQTPAGQLWKERKGAFPFLLVIDSQRNLDPALNQLVFKAAADYFMKIEPR